MCIHIQAITFPYTYTFFRLDSGKLILFENRSKIFTFNIKKDTLVTIKLLLLLLFISYFCSYRATFLLIT